MHAEAACVETMLTHCAGRYILRQIMPTAEEVEAAHNFSGDHALLAKADK